MIPPPLPPDEPERLASLKALGLLDTASEERFDRITRLARTLFDVPIALISLVDADRQWFKSRQGLEAAQTSREVSFCGHAILGSGLFVVPDAERDERFRGNPLVAGEDGIKFYAGAPLSGPDGRKIGTLCLADRKPRALTAEQQAALKDLAAFAEREIAETGRTAPASRKNPDQARLRAARDRRLAAAFGTAVVLILSAAAASYRGVRGLVESVHEVARAHSVLQELEGAPDPDRLRAARLLLAGEPDQLRRLDAADALAARGGARRDPAAFEAAIEAVAAPERREIAERAGRVDEDAHFLVIVAAFARGVGALVIILAYLTVRRYVRERSAAEDALTEARDAAMRDADARREAQEDLRRLGDRLRAVLDHLADGVVLVEPDGRIALFNLAAERIHGSWRGEFEAAMREGKSKILRPDGSPLGADEEPLARALKGESSRGARVLFRTPFRPNGYLVEASAAPLRSPQGPVAGAVLVFHEVSSEAAK